MPFEVEVRNRIGEIVFDHPPVNAFDSAMWLELPDIVYELAQRNEVRCLLIRAEGKGFCAMPFSRIPCPRRRHRIAVIAIGRLPSKPTRSDQPFSPG